MPCLSDISMTLTPEPVDFLEESPVRCRTGEADTGSALAPLGVLEVWDLDPCSLYPESSSTLERVDTTDLERSTAGAFFFWKHLSLTCRLLVSSYP